MVETARRIETIAGELVGLLGTGRQISPLSSRHPGFDEVEAYGVAARVRDLRAMRGERAIGRKIGFTNATVQRIYGVAAPIWNHMFDSTVRDFVGVRCRIDLTGLPEPRLEPEIALRVAKTPRADMTDDELLGCLDGVAHGFEIVQSIFPGWRFTAADSIAAFGLHGAYRLGAWRPVADCPREWAEALASFRVELACDDGRVLEGGGANVLGSPLSALRRLLVAIETSTPDQHITAGEIVTTGTLTDAPAILPGETWTTRFEGVTLDGLTLQTW